MGETCDGRCQPDSIGINTTIVYDGNGLARETNRTCAACGKPCPPGTTITSQPVVSVWHAPAMPQCVAELVDVMHSAYLAKFPELCGTRVEERINAAIASVRAYYGSRP